MRTACCLPMIFWISASFIGFQAATSATDPSQTPRPAHWPETVTLKSDLIFYVPFSVTGDYVPVKAGTQVFLKEVRENHLKLVYGPGELTVDPAVTDFAEQMQRAPQPPASQGNSSKAVDQSGVPWLVVFIVVAFFVAGSLGIFGARLRRNFRSDVQQRNLELARSGQPSRNEIERALNDLDWFQFEKLMSALFRAQGHTVEMRGGANADGGIDLLVGLGTDRMAVQCKHWVNWKCSPNVVRELLGAMTHEGFAQGVLVCRRATTAAHDLARQTRITVIEREEVARLVKDSLEFEGTTARRLLFSPEKLCPKCGAKMLRRTVAKGLNADSQFWGCSTYPKCRQTMKA